MTFYLTEEVLEDIIQKIERNLSDINDIVRCLFNDLSEILKKCGSKQMNDAINGLISFCNVELKSNLNRLISNWKSSAGIKAVSKQIDPNNQEAIEYAELIEKKIADQLISSVIKIDNISTDHSNLNFSYEDFIACSDIVKKSDGKLHFMFSVLKEQFDNENIVYNCCYSLMVNFFQEFHLLFDESAKNFRNIAKNVDENISKIYNTDSLQQEKNFEFNVLQSFQNNAWQSSIDYKEWETKGGMNIPYKTFDGAGLRETVNSSDIYGIHDTENPNFWTCVPKSKEEYIAVASCIPRVEELLKKGKSIDKIISMGGIIGICASQYFKNPIQVMKYGNAYIHCDDGRHRVIAAQIANVKIPVNIVQEFYRSKGSLATYVSPYIKTEYSGIIQFRSTNGIMENISIRRTVYRNSNINPDFIIPAGTVIGKEITDKEMTNLERMQAGKSPVIVIIDKNGNIIYDKIELHHLTSTERNRGQKFFTSEEKAGSIVEIQSSIHRKYTRQLHAINISNNSFRKIKIVFTNEQGRKIRKKIRSYDVKQYEKFRKQYWKDRAIEIIQKNKK